MPNNQNIAIGFIDGNVQKHILYTFQVLNNFVKKFGPEIERIHLEFSFFSNRPFISIKKDDILNYINIDIKSARSALLWYRNTMNVVENRLVLMTSNFGLFDFLRENGIPISDVGEVQGLINNYWNITYAPLIGKLNMAYLYLQELNRLLNEQIKLAEELTKLNYFDGFEKLENLAKLFEEERIKFWNLSKIIEISKSDFIQVNNLYNSELKKLKYVAKAYIDLLRGTLGADIKNSRGGVKKGVIVLMYVAGAAFLYSNLKNTLIRNTAQGVLKRLLGIFKTKDTNISQTTKKLADLGKEGFEDIGEGTLGLIMGL